MNIKRIGIFVAILLSAGAFVQAQQASSLRINEIMVVNETNFQDDYGMHNAWVELFNTSYGTVNVAGCFLTDDRNNPKKYSIPKGDILTQIKPRQHLLFWADNQPWRGTFHLSFTLDPNKENYIALYNTDGTTLIDEVTIPAGMLPDHSWARTFDGKDGWEMRGTTVSSNEYWYVTPSTNNITLDTNEKIEKFERHDSVGIGMTVTAMGVVFTALILLYLFFRVIGVISVKMSARNAMKAHGITDMEEAKEKGFGSRSGEEFAAIAMAMHEMQEDVHDIEDMVLTINKVKRTYSPWSSKIYTLTELPRK
ncbi:MAG: OadG family protein [Prevotellaceae bacterium]|jgi:Na+-transporting methylmalonyl-CoA/oxaloacetate decarboxylase gamma subunit|nr:OadG family protein [Prevotellaceae bacterium]